MTITMPMRELMKSLSATIVVKGTKTFNLRCSIGVLLLRVAAWVLPIKTDVEVKL